MQRIDRMVARGRLEPNQRNARTHSKQQIRELARSIEAFGFTAPIITDENGIILAGHGRFEAAKLLALAEVPVVELRGLSDARKRALALADNKLAEKAGWDRQRLALELPEVAEILIEEGLELSLTGFEPVEVDQIATDLEDDSSDPADEVDPNWARAPVVSQLGDLWLLNDHRLLCGEARDASDLGRLLDGTTAAMAFLDPPYNVRVKDIVGRGRTKHREFAMASGEMSAAAFTTFLVTTLKEAAKASRDGAVHYVCMDWRHIAELVSVGREIYGDMLNLAVWIKGNAGQGSFYRSQHELIGVFRVGRALHLNNVELGRHGRNRSNVWRYGGVNSFGPGRTEQLASHPTIKPVALVADAIKDCTRRGEVVLDTFCGSGTTVLAAERVGRRGYGLEIDPVYVDTAVRRWQSFTGRDAVLASTGATFDEVEAERASKSAKRRGAGE